MAVTAGENAGVFTCAQLQKVMVEVDRIWADTQRKRDYESKVEALRAIRENQTARLSALQDPAKDNVLKVFWPSDCTSGLDDCGDDCEIGGPEPEANCQDHELDICKTTGFQIKEKLFRTIEGSREQYVAVALARRLKELDEFLAQTVIAKLNAFAGDNKFLGGIGDPDANGTYIAASYWTPEIYGYFTQVMIMNQFSTAYMLHGSNLFQMYWNAQKNSANSDTKDQLLKMTSLPSYWDMFNVDSVNVGQQVSYMITPGAVAFVNKAYYPLNSPLQVTPLQQRWSIESKALPGVYYDVYYTSECSGNEIYHKWSLYVKAGFFLNPLGCDPDVTGVIKFICGENAGS